MLFIESNVTEWLLQNQMLDAMTIWQGIAHSEWFKGTKFVSWIPRPKLALLLAEASTRSSS